MEENELINKKAVDCYKRTDIYVTNNNINTEFGFLNGFYEGYITAKRDLYNCFCKQCEYYDKKSRCTKYNIYQSFNRETDCEKIRVIFNS